MLRDKNGLTEEEFLKQYKPSDYERPSVTVDMMLLGLNKDYTSLKILLIQRGGHPYMNCWALQVDLSIWMSRLIKQQTES